MNTSGTSLRNELQKARSALTNEAQEAAADAIVAPVLQSIDELGPSAPGIVAAYVAHGGELDVLPAALALRSVGWSIALPVCGPSGSMEFCPWQPGDELASNIYGIGEPTTQPHPLTAIDVVLVPGVGFDHAMSRIGHGVGFYDRYFARCFAADHDPVRLAIAHDVQIVELPKPEPWDVPMHRVLTPTKVLDRT